MKKTTLISTVLLFLTIKCLFSQETISWKNISGGDENQVRQNLETGAAAFVAKNFEGARTAYAKVVSTANSPAQYRSYAQLRIAQSYMAENNSAATRAEYEKIKANNSYPVTHRYEAEEYIKEIDRVAKGLPAHDVMESRTKVEPVSGFVAEFYVSPKGKDSNPGTSKKPFATLGKARDAVRILIAKGLTGPVAVNVLPGVYQVKETLALTSEDSGTPSAPIVYRAEKMGTAVLYGGKRLSGFTLVSDPAVNNKLPQEARGKVYQCDLKKLGINEYDELIERGYGVNNPPPAIELFFNEKSLTIARWPNKGFVNGGNVIDIGARREKKNSIFEYLDPRPSRWVNAKDGWLYGYFSNGWADRTLKIISIDTLKKTITSGPGNMRVDRWFNNGKIRYHAFNMLEEMDIPGEWYMDREKGIIYFYPPSDPKKATIEIGMFSQPMLTMSNVSNVRVEGLVFDLSRVSCIFIDNSENCLIAGCTIKRFAASGIKITGGKNDGIYGCDIYSMGRLCTHIIGGDRPTLTPANHFVENCRMYDFGQVDHTYVHGVLLEGVGNRVAHNLFYNCPANVVRLEGNDHIVEFNIIHDALLETEDQGGMEMFGNPSYRGDIFRYNLYSNIGYNFTGPPTGAGIAGIRLDDGICGIQVYGNIFHNTSRSFGGINFNGGRDNIIDNNLFTECQVGISGTYHADNKIWAAFDKGEPKERFIKNGLYYSKYPDLGHVLKEPVDNFVWRAIFWNCGRTFDTYGKKQLGDFDIIAPGEYTSMPSIFVNLEKGDYNLRPDAAFFNSIGFRPIPVDEIGLYDDVYRASPVKK